MSENQFRLFKRRLREALDGENASFPFVTRKQTALALSVCALASPARLAIIPVQDLMLLGDESRMNVPSVAEGNWKFRLKTMPTRYSAAVMRKINEQYSR